MRAACRHATDKNARIERVFLHSDAVAQDRAAADRTGGIHGDDRHLFALPAVRGSELIDECALAGARIARHANHFSMQSRAFESIKHGRAVDVVVFDQ